MIFREVIVSYNLTALDRFAVAVRNHEVTIVSLRIRTGSVEYVVAFADEDEVQRFVTEASPMSTRVVESP